MLQRLHSSSRSFLVLAALASGLAALSCGGTERDTVVGPPPAQPLAATDQGTVTASATARLDICHYDRTLDTYTTLSLTASGVAAHIPKHVKDYNGTCATCPCFTKATIDALGATCSVGLLAQCSVQYSVHLYCTASPVFANLGYFEAQVGTGTCMSQQTQDSAGNWVTVTKPVSATEFAVCKDAIVTSAPYPPSCPP